MKLTPKAYADTTDYWRIREFLRKVYALNGRRERAWSLLRWDYWRWHVHENICQFDLGEVVRLWEVDGEIAAVLNPDGPGEGFLQIHPQVEQSSLVEEMLTAAEGCLSVPGPTGRPTLRVWADAADHERQRVLTARGYEKRNGAEHQRRRSMALPIPATPMPDGYQVRALGDESELPARSWVSWKAFHPDEPDARYQGWTWYRNVQRVPLYRRDLDVVAIAPNGEHAAFSTAWFDDVTRTVVFEPVGTHPDHRQRGLGKAVMAEGLRRALSLGAELATVGSYSAAAHVLYASLGFVDFDLSEPWEKCW